MQITLSNGKVFEVEFVGTLLRDGKRVVIEMVDDRALSQIAPDFEGVETITKTNSKNLTVKEVYEGFTQLVEIHRNTAAGTVRLTLERSASDD